MRVYLFVADDTEGVVVVAVVADAGSVAGCVADAGSVVAVVVEDGGAAVAELEEGEVEGNVEAEGWYGVAPEG